MKVKFIIFFSALSFFSLVFSVATRTEENPAKIYQGHWGVDCSKPISLQFGQEKSAILTVNANQIYIEVKYKEVAGDLAELFYVQPDELGMGGSQINWDAISTSEKVGSLRLIGDKKAIFSWFGFFDLKTKKHILLREAEFSTAKNEIILVRCD